MQFIITEDVLLTIKRLNDTVEFNVVKKWLSGLSEQYTQLALYNCPDPNDFSYDTRSRIFQGIAISLNLLNKICHNPDAVIEDIRKESETNMENELQRQLSLENPTGEGY